MSQSDILTSNPYLSYVSLRNICGSLTAHDLSSQISLFSISAKKSSASSQMSLSMIHQSYLFIMEVRVTYLHNVQLKMYSYISLITILSLKT